MALSIIRMELARTPEAPRGDPENFYEFIAPLDAEGRLDIGRWKEDPQICTMRRFSPDADNARGQLVHTRSGDWAFSYRPGEDDDEPIYRLAEHRFREGDYISVAEPSGESCPFRIVSVRPWTPDHRP